MLAEIDRTSESSTLPPKSVRLTRIAVVCAETTLSGLELELIRWLRAHPKFKLAGLWSSGDPAVRRSRFAKLHRPRALAFEMLERLEQRRLANSGPHHAYLQRHDPDSADVRDTAGPLQRLDADPATAVYVRALDADLVLALGEVAHPQQLAALAPDGLLMINPPVGRRHAARSLADVLDQLDRLPFRIVRLRPGAVEFEVLTSSAIPNGRNFVANRANLQRRAHMQLQRVLERWNLERRKSPRRMQTEPATTPWPAPPAPTLSNQARYLMHRFGASLSARVDAQLGRDDLWRVGVLRGHWRGLGRKRFMTLPNPAANLLADPFVIHRNGRDYCFAEALDFRRPRGYIVVYEIGIRSARLLGTALAEDFHLSFPYLFEYQGRLFMCPESHQSGQIRVYESTHFPLGWRLHSVLMQGVSAADSMLFEARGRWWLLTNIDSTGISDHCSELHLFWADSPLSNNWTPHPMNPLVTDPEFGRNGGLLREGQKLYRVSQRQGYESYGKGTAVHEIVRIDTEHYQETRVADIGAGLITGADGTHHLHSNGRLTVFDFRRRELF